MRRILYFSLVLFLLSACKGKQTSSSTNSTIDSSAVKTSDTEYTCPMHPEVITKEPGKCPRCGMDLEAKS